MSRTKPSVIIPVILVLVILFSVVYVLIFPMDKTVAPSKSASSQGKNTSSHPSSAPDRESSEIAAGSYVDYKDGIIASTSGEKLLFFHAQWCPQCRELEADIKKGPIPENTTIIKVNFDNSQTLRQKYGVTQQTTVVRVNDDESLAKKFVAYNDPSLEAVINGTR